MRRLLFTAPDSGAGKTTLTTGLLAALIARGLRPSAFKCGPDFIDPMFHRDILGGIFDCRGANLDLFLTQPRIAKALLAQTAAGTDIAVIEGAMGYYDGVGTGDRASAWQVAGETETPAVLVIRPKGACRTLAAVIAGLARFRENSRIHGILLNRCSDAFADKLTPMLEKETGIRVYGHLPETPEAVFESRHLGLTPPSAVAGIRARLRALADQIAKSIDIDGLLALAETAPQLWDAALPPVEWISGTPVRIAVAKDAAFCFHYEENLRLLRALGAETVFFSPLADARLPAGADALILCGGYPELHAAQLADNTSLRRAIKQAVAGGLPTIAEGGGFLYLQTELVDAAGGAHAMAGLFPGTGRDAERLVRFGYATLRARADNLLCAAGEEFPAHEFHRWDSDAAGDTFTATKASDGTSWLCAVASPTLYAGFPHLYFWSNPEIARNFIQAAAAFKTRRRHAQ